MNNKRKKRTSGFTLIEVLVVFLLIAMAGTIVGVAVVPGMNKAKKNKAATDVQAIRSAVILYQTEGNVDCPDMETLIESGNLEKGKAKADPWGIEYQIECDGSDASVTSAGGDKEFGTEDDIGI